MGRFFAALLLLAGCQADIDHPPPAPGCPPGENCTPPPIMGGGGGSSGAGGSAGAAGSASSVLEGNVVEFRGDDFRDATPFTQAATIEAEGASGGVVSASWNGSAPFELANLRVTDPTWVSARALNTLAVLRTLNAVEPGTDLAILGLVRTESIDFVLQLLTVPAERVPGAAHIVLRITPRPGALEGVAGVTVSLPDASTVSYAAQGTWTEDGGTDATGLVVLGNVAAPAFPGVTRTATLRGTVSGSVGIRVASDAATVLEVAATDFGP